MLGVDDHSREAVEELIADIRQAAVANLRDGKPSWSHLAAIRAADDGGIGLDFSGRWVTDHTPAVEDLVLVGHGRIISTPTEQVFRLTPAGESLKLTYQIAPPPLPQVETRPETPDGPARRHIAGLAVASAVVGGALTELVRGLLVSL